MKQIARYGAILMTAGLFLPLTGCTLPRAAIQPDIKTNLEKPVVPDDKDLTVKRHDDAVVEIPIGGNFLIPSPIQESDPLPLMTVEKFNAINTTALDAFRLLLTGRGISVTAEADAGTALVNSVNLRGSLVDVLDNLSESSGLFYTYRRGAIRLMSEQSFVLRVPPMLEGAIEDVVGVIEAMGAKNVKADRNGRMVTFRANRIQHDAVLKYLESIRQNKVLIVYDTFFYQVRLTDGVDTGIDWTRLQATAGEFTFRSAASTTPSGGTTPLGVANGVSLGTVFSANDIEVDTLVSFLQTQGDVETISKPTISVLSGSEAKFQVGSKIKYVSRITRSDTTTGSTTNSQSSTAEVEDLELGLILQVLGDYQDDTVYSKISLSINELVDFRIFEAGGGDTLRLPETTTRDLETYVRIRPGDTILIAGINQTRDDRKLEGPPTVNGVMPFFTSTDQAIERLETVIIMRPRVVKFIEQADYTPPSRRVNDDNASVPAITDAASSSPVTTPAPSDVAGEILVDGQPATMSTMPPTTAPTYLPVAPLPLDKKIPALTPTPLTLPPVDNEALGKRSYMSTQ